MELPTGHPPVNAAMYDNECPALRKGHEWQKLPTDIRSPCPALNTLANHGYIPRDGKNITAWQLTTGLMKGYNLSFPLASFLSVGGFFLLRKFWSLNLHDVARHGRVEHDASLVHADTPPNSKYAPIHVLPNLVNSLIKDATTGMEEGEGPEFGDRQILVDATDVARARVRREKESPPLGPIPAEIARGEMAIILGVWEQKRGTNVGVPANWLRMWIQEERMPSDFRFTHVQGLLNVKSRASQIKKAMEDIRRAEAQAYPREKSHL